jgi:hypothetical protein
MALSRCPDGRSMGFADQIEKREYQLESINKLDNWGVPQLH